MNEVEAHSRDGLWVLLKLERLKAHALEVGVDDDMTEGMTAPKVGHRLTVRADDKIDPSRLISVFRTEIERTTGVVPAAMQPFYVYGVVVFEWHEARQAEDELLLSSLRDLVTKSDLKRSAVSPQ
jgi:hypothetical protein